MNIHQVVNALDFGDAVSNSVVTLKRWLNEAGYNSNIYGLSAHELQKTNFIPVAELTVNPEDIVLYHFSGSSSIVDQMADLHCHTLMVYHNITPAHFFIGNEPLYNLCSEGLEQLHRYISKFDGFIADSEFNRNDLLRLGAKTVDVMPIAIDFNQTHIPRFEETLPHGISISPTSTNFLFVGRVAPNKKHEDIIDVFEYYYSNISEECNLFFVGNYQNCPDYYNYLQNKIFSLRSKKQIYFSGKISDLEVQSLYRMADFFLCMSEHEGFCVPLLESMHYGVPTIAFDAGAVKETMGNAGVLLFQKDPATIAKMCVIILHDHYLRSKIIEKQTERLKSFDKIHVMKKMESIIAKYR